MSSDMDTRYKLTKEQKDRLVEFSKTIPKETIDNFNVQYRKMVSRQISDIYIDLTYLHDIYLGGILHMTADKPVYKYIKDQLERYNIRMIPDHASHFPELNISEDELFSYISNPQVCSDLIKISPPTDMYHALSTINRATIYDNKCKISKDVKTIETLTYVINTYPLKLSKEDMIFLKSRFMLGCGTTNLKFGVICQPSWNMNVNVYSRFDVMYVYDFYRWCDDKTSIAHQLLFKEGGPMMYTNIYIPPRITNPEILEKVKEYTDDDFLALEKSTLIAYNSYAEVKYARASVIVQ